MNIKEKLHKQFNHRDIEFSDIQNIIKAFCGEVEALAEEKMVKTGRLEGAHYAAMKQLLKELND